MSKNIWTDIGYEYRDVCLSCKHFNLKKEHNFDGRCALITDPHLGVAANGWCIKYEHDATHKPWPEEV